LLLHGLRRGGCPHHHVDVVATIQWLMVPLVHRPRQHGAAHTHFIFLVGVTSGVLVLLPTTGFYVLEGTWTYLDAPVSRIGGGGWIPPRIPPAPKLEVLEGLRLSYLLLGLMGILLLAQTFHQLAELHGGISAPDEATELLEGTRDREKPAGGAKVWGEIHQRVAAHAGTHSAPHTLPPPLQW
uniref:Uncharacterized protein n=1 Tax=Accipiter nisus TaxID=211598 RepID=A0A8B9N166_9AVES